MALPCAFQQANASARTCPACRISPVMKPTALALPALATAVLATALRNLALPDRVRPGQVAIITGGSRGLGLALAHRFGRAGCKLVLAARNADELELARDGLLRDRSVQNEDDVQLVACDLTDRDQIPGLIAAALNTFGALDILINNAGIIEVGPVENQALATYDRTMATNFFAALHTIYAAMPHMLEKRSGAIVNICSIGGKIPVPHMLPYVAAKFALTGFSEGLHAELRYKGIRVTTVCPGLLRSGGENHAHFVGDVAAEKKWFDLGAKTPFVAADVHHAAKRIFSAVNRGAAEMTITPQAWLAARVFGLAPSLSQNIAALANEYILPSPAEPFFHDDAEGHSHPHGQEPAPSAVEQVDPSPS